MCSTLISNEQAIFIVDLEGYFARLSYNEIHYIKHKTMDGMSDVTIKRRLKVTFENLKEMKRNIRRQIGWRLRRNKESAYELDKKWRLRHDESL